MMKWSTVWELTKINILYSNPQSLAALKKKQEKKGKKNFKAYKAMLRQQAFTTFVFLFIYIFMFFGFDFSSNPGYFSFYIALFFVMSTLTAFNSLYTIFYDSNDLKLYVHLPIDSKEIYVAKFLSSLGMGSMFLMPLLSLFIITYWQILGNFLAIPLALVLFAILFISSNVLALYLNTWIGKIIVRSPKKKLISTILMFFSTFGAIALIFFLNFTNGKRMASEGAISDYALIPYFRGYYDTVHQPFSLPALFHFWLPLLVIAIMLVGIVKRVMPKYYEEALYVSAKMQTKKKTKPKSHAYVDKSLSHLMRKHHLSTIQDSSLLIQTFLMPLIYIVGFTMPLLTGGNRLMSYLTNDYFGIAFAFGIIIASMCVSPSSFVGVGISVEKDNFIFLKSLPIVFTKFLKEKFYFLLFLQVLIPIIFYTIFLLLVIKVRLVLAIAFVIGYLLTCFVQGQWMYKRDLKHLNLKWQNMTQLYTRSGSQWLTLAFIMGSMMIGFSLIALLAILSMITHQALLINSLFVIVALIVFVILELILKKIFWDKLALLIEEHS